MVSRKKIKVSFVLGILNAERTLHKCLKSILNQNYPKEKYEIIIVDGGSKDSTLKISKAFAKNYKNIRILHNPGKLSEGRGMSKDIGVRSSRGEIVIFLDHDNIILNREWLNDILEPFTNKDIMASQSLLKSMKGDSNFLKYINEIGVEDPFAVPYSLTAQISLNKEKFEVFDNKYVIFQMTKDKNLFIGANGCAFRKKTFDLIEGYIRDVDVSARMAEKEMLVAVPINTKIYHATSNDFLSFMIKKGIYFYRFINKEYSKKDFEWGKTGYPPSRIKFFIMVMLNLSIVYQITIIMPKFIASGKIFWLLHPFYVFFVTIEYGLITLLRIKNFVKYV